MGSEKVGKFKIYSKFRPSGDQPKAISELIENFDSHAKNQVLLGVTGSGKTFTMAHIIEKLNEPTLVLAPNKTLAAQLFQEFKDLFPENAVEYFVSYYDYYQPEAYIPSTNTFIEKDSAINDQIDRMRHSATRSLFDRNDVLIVSSVSCIYGLGSPEAYEGMMIHLRVNDELKREHLISELVRVLYTRNDIDFSRGSFRVRGDTVEIHPPYEEERSIRVEFFGDFIDRMSWVDPIRGVILSEMDTIGIYPGSHYANTEERMKKSIQTIRKELQEYITDQKKNMKILEAQRIEQRTYYDIEMMEELGFCHGIENYSRHFSGRTAGQPPPTLLEYFPRDFLCIVDESHITIPQIGAMYRGDRARKLTLVEHGFRLPSALDNRPLNFQEFENCIDKAIYVSATPGTYELDKSKGLVVEQIIRPTGLVDPIIKIKPAAYQVDDLVKELKIVIQRKERALITTLTKKSAEDLTEYLETLGLKVRYLHSDLKTVERTQIIKDLRLGLFDVLIGINLLREGLDIPEVSLVAITDADKEGFLRSERSLIQTIGRAARNQNGQVILYADIETHSIKKALQETERRRKIQSDHNKKYGITPQTITKRIQEGLDEIVSLSSNENIKKRGDNELKFLIGKPKILHKKIKSLKKKMKLHAENLEFEEAVKIRDEIKRWEMLELESLGGEEFIKKVKNE